MADKLCILERGATPIPLDHPLVEAGGTLAADSTQNDWNRKDPIGEADAIKTLWARFQSRPRVLKLHGLGKASWDALNWDTTGKANVETLWVGMQGNRLIVSPDVGMLNELSDRLGSSKPAVTLVDDEPGNLIWSEGFSDTDPRKPLENAAWDRRNWLLVKIFQSDKCRGYIGPDIADVPRDAAGIIAAFDWQHNPNFDRWQCALERWWSMLRMKGVKDILTRVGWYPGVMVRHDFCGKYPAGMKQGNWTIPQTPIVAGWMSAWQCYDDAGDPRSNTRWAYQMSTSVRWHPTWSGASDPEDIKDRLLMCSPNGCSMWMHDLDRSALHAGAVKEYVWPI